MLFTLGFPAAPALSALTLPRCAARRTVLQKVRGQAHAALPQFAGTGFQVLFHSPPGVLFTFPSQYYALSVAGGIQPCGVVPAPSHRVSRAPWYSGSCCACSMLRLRGFHPLRPAFPGPFCCTRSTLTAVLNPKALAPWFGLFRFRSPLLPESTFP